jgi:hypothetical protein
MTNERVKHKSLYIEESLWDRTAREAADGRILNTSALICKILRKHWAGEDRRRERAQARKSA